jgi:hypothetical protein
MNMHYQLMVGTAARGVLLCVIRCLSALLLFLCLSSFRVALGARGAGDENELTRCDVLPYDASP